MNEHRPSSLGYFRLVTRNEGHPPAHVPVPAPYGLEILDNCITCPHREERLFCNLPPEVLQRLSAISSASSYPKGATLFVEGQTARGVFILCGGRVKLSTASIDGKTLIVRISESGDLLGLPATVTGRPYDLTAEVIEPTQLKFVPRQDFLNFIRENGEIALRVAQVLGESYHAAVAEMRTIGLSHSAREKLARFILDWSTNHNSDGEGIKVKLTLTHEEIAEMIGVSRETVTRIFADFKKKNLLTVKGSTLTIKSREGLELIGQN